MRQPHIFVEIDWFGDGMRSESIKCIMSVFWDGHDINKNQVQSCIVYEALEVAVIHKLLLSAINESKLHCHGKSSWILWGLNVNGM